MAKIIREFVDRNTKKTIPVGEYGVNAEREAELVAAGVAEDPAKKVVEEAAEKEVAELTVAEIKTLLDEKGIEYNTKANKNELKALLEGAE